MQLLEKSCLRKLVNGRMAAEYLGRPATRDENVGRLPQAVTPKAACEIERDPRAQAVAKESERMIKVRGKHLYKGCQQWIERSKRRFPKPIVAARQMDAHYLNSGRQPTRPAGKGRRTAAGIGKTE